MNTAMIVCLAEYLVIPLLHVRRHLILGKCERHLLDLSFFII